MVNGGDKKYAKIIESWELRIEALTPPDTPV